MENFIYNVFDISDKNGKVVTSINSENKLDIDNIKNLGYSKLCFERDFTKNLCIGHTYFILCNDNIIGIFTPHFGYSFFDVAEHDERVLIKQIFPKLKCHIIDEN